MPRWDVAELPDAPLFRARSLLKMVGPGLVMGAAAIGGGEWLAGPAVTAKYGPALLWVATVSILFQVVYNIEISRYTLYTGEPIFTGKLRIPPGPLFWVGLYLLLDWGSIAPYLATNAAVPIETLWLGRLPDADRFVGDWWLHKFVATAIYLLCMVPLMVGGKVYNSLKVVMSAKLVIVIGFLLFVGAMFTRPAEWLDIGTGLFKFGTVPVVRDGGGSEVDNIFVALSQGRAFPAIDFALIGTIAGLAAIAGNGGLTNTPISNFTRDQGWGMGYHVGAIPSLVGGQGITLSHVGCVFDMQKTPLARWRRWVRHVVREQLLVWMGACLIGVSLPSILSVGFLPRGTDARDWSGAAMTASGVRDHVTQPRDGVLAASPGLKPWITGSAMGQLAWMGTLLCGFLVLATSQVTTMDGFVRRWVDVFWTASPRLRRLEVSEIRLVYVSVLLVYSICGLTVLWCLDKPSFVFRLATTGYNYAFAFSAWHTIFINQVLLPQPLRPHPVVCVLMALAGCFFTFLGVMSTLQLMGKI
jgi:hypothetical protein